MSKITSDKLAELVELLSQEALVRKFKSGATRDDDTDKLDYEGFFSPSVLIRYAAYMHQNRKQADGKMRDSDNWQKGIPRDQYMKSMLRHMMDAWFFHRLNYNIDSDLEIEEALCAVLFNAMGYIYEVQEGR